MGVSSAPREAPAGASDFLSPALLRLASDKRLVALVRQGRHAAFEELYDRHHRQLLSFCRHILGDPEDAQDAVQHTFLAAYNSLIASEKPITPRAWLYTIARNRCYSLLRARREQPSSELEEPSTDGLATEVQCRQDLRELVLDVQRLPYQQRAALVLAELEAMSHEQIGEVLGVPKDKVKSLVFQARESLVANRIARETDCVEIRLQLATLRGGALRRGTLRRHLRECEACREYRREVERKRRRLALALPVAPIFQLREAIAGTGASAGGGLLASVGLKAGGMKLIAGAVLAAVGAAGTFVAGAVDGSRHAGSVAAAGQLSSRPPTPLPTTEQLALGGPQVAVRRLTVSALASVPNVQHGREGLRILVPAGGPGSALIGEHRVSITPVGAGSVATRWHGAGPSRPVAVPQPGSYEPTTATMPTTIAPPPEVGPGPPAAHVPLPGRIVWPPQPQRRDTPPAGAHHSSRAAPARPSPPPPSQNAPRPASQNAPPPAEPSPRPGPSSPALPGAPPPAHGTEPPGQSQGDAPAVTGPR